MRALPATRCSLLERRLLLFAPLGSKAFDMLLAKQLRSEYFNMQLYLMSSLDKMSTQLARVPRKKRTELMRAYIRTLDLTTAKGYVHRAASIRLTTAHSDVRSMRPPVSTSRSVQ